MEFENKLKKVLNSKIVNDLKNDVVIKYPYGTAGFRYNHKIILNDLALPIGEFLGYLNFYFGKTLGIMITASHNPIDDNGVKIVNDDGEMVGNTFEELITLYCNGKKNIKKAIIQELEYNFVKEKVKRPKIVIGMDTRPSSVEIFEMID